MNLVDKKCKFDSPDCGEHKKSRKNGIYPMQQLTDEVIRHIENLGLRSTHFSLSEKELIENRSGTRLSNDDCLCAFHRYKFGICWKPSSRCQHPQHAREPGTWQKNKKARVDIRPANLDLANRISKEYVCNFPIGESVCSRHRKTESKSDDTRKVESEQAAAESLEQVESEGERESMDVDDDPAFEVKNKGENVNEFVDKSGIVGEDASPMKFNVQSPVQNLAPSTVRYLERKYRQYTEKFKKNLCEKFAPGQGTELEKILENDEDTTDDHDFLVTTLEAYNNCTTEGARLAVLSIIPCRYSQRQISDEFGCSIYLIKKARSLAANYGPAGSVPQVTVHRNKLDHGKAEHFLDFLFDTGLLQDVAYGTTTLKYDSGDKQTVAHSVLTALKNHVVYAYMKYCDDVSFAHLSRSTLLKIISAIKPSQRRALGGLDNTTANGLEAVDGLITVIKDDRNDFQNVKLLCDKLQSGKRYIKVGFKVHCVESPCATHCCTFALSDADEDLRRECDHEHAMTCVECNEIVETLDKILSEANRIDNDELLYDVKRYIDSVLEWIRHSLRGVQQDKAKHAGFEICREDNEYAFWLRDWAQKVLPLSFREKQSDYFGKKGMSLHIDVFFQKENSGNLCKLVYFTVIFRCDQDMLSTLNVADHVLNQYRKDNPKVKKLLTKSDNAGCYAAASTFEAEYRICKKYGIELVRHDFNEPQCGKDQADRESAVARKLMRAYVDAGNDLLDASDVKSAIEYQGGVPNAKVSVIEIDKSRTEVTNVKIPNSQSIHSVRFYNDHMVVWNYYGIGPGKRVGYYDNDFSIVPAVTVLEPFEQAVKSQDSMTASKTRADRVYCDKVFCIEPGCTDSFSTALELAEHIGHGKHNSIISESLTSMDKVRITYGQRISTSAMAHACIAESSYSFNPDMSTHAEYVSSQGWALKPKRKVRRLNVRQKDFVLGCFLDGERTGKKTTPEKVAALMRTKEDQEGTKMFTTDEYLTREQILSQFSQMAAKKKRGEKLELSDVREYQQELQVRIGYIFQRFFQNSL